MFPFTRRHVDATISTDPGSEPERARPRRAWLRVGSVSVAACTVAVVAATQIPTANAAPEPALYAFGSDSLLASQDFHDVGVRLDEQRVQLFGGQALSACSGEKTLYSVAGREVAEVGARWTSLRNADQLLTETVGRTATRAQATTLARRLTAEVKRCQDEPAGHWHYGRTRTLKVGSGSATWMLTYGGDGIVSGGVAVIRDGNTVGILELTSPSGPAKKTVQQVVTAATERLE